MPFQSEAAGTVPLPLQAESQQDRRPFRELLDSEPNRKAFIKAVQGPLMDKICSHKDVIKPQGTVDAKAPNAATELYNHLLSHADETCILKVLCIISASPSKEDTPEANRMQHELLHHFPHLISTMCRELGVKEDIAVIPTEVDLRTIADECGNASNSLLTYLGIRNVKIEQFRKDAATFTDGTQSALIFWLKGNAADEPTWESLLKAMEKAQMTNESKEWKQKIIDRYQELHGFSN